MTTTDTVLLIILTSLLSFFFLLAVLALILLIRILLAVRRVVTRAGSLVDSVEAAAEVFKDASGRMAIFKLIKNIIDLTKGKK